MQGLSKERALQSLRARIESIEKRPPLVDAAGQGPANSGLFVLPPGAVHEVFAESQHDAGATLGFAFALAHGLVRLDRPAVLYLQLDSDAQEIGFPYGAGLSGFGLDPETLVFIRPAGIVELLWAMEEALACRAVAAVIADVAYPHKALDFTASRRLALRAAASGASVFLLAYGSGREASASRFRWRIGAQISRAPPHDSRAPGLPRWDVRLEKGRLGRRKTSPEGDVYLVDWTENGFVLADDKGRDRAAAEAGRALPRALPAALGDRLPQAG